MRARACVGGKVNRSHMIAHELHNIPEYLIILQTTNEYKQESGTVWLYIYTPMVEPEVVQYVNSCSFLLDVKLIVGI